MGINLRFLVEKVNRSDRDVKAAFQLRVFYTYVHARKSLNPIQYYI